MNPNDMYTNPVYANPQAGQSTKLKLIIAGGIVFFLLLILMWVAGRSSLLIEVTNPAGSGEITYTITDESGKATTTQTTAASLKKSLSKGNYQVGVRQSGNSHVSLVQTKGFFGQTKVSARLEPESARRFVGVNPGDCMYYIGTNLLSGSCGVGYENLEVHKPATDELPSLTEGFIPQELYGPLEGVAYTKFGTVALVQQSYSEDEPRGHYASIVSDNLIDSNRTFLKGLDVNKSYSIKAYREGFIAYDSDMKDIYYIAGLSVAPVKLSVQAPKDKAFSPYLVGVSEDAVVVAYSDHQHDEIVEHTDTDEGEDVNIEIAVLTGTTEKHFSLKGNMREALYCGTNRLCTVSGDTLRVYDISGKKAAYLFTVPGVQTMDMTSKGLLAVTNTGAVLLDTTKQQGFMEYTLDKYTFCGLTATRTGYVLCIQNPRNRKNALFIDQTNRASDNIDKKVLQLSDLDNVSLVSPFGNYIYVIPDYGVAEYNAELGGDTFNPATVRKVNATIDDTVKKLGLNTPPYKVVSTGYNP